MPPVADAKSTSSYLILNPAAGSLAALLGSLTGAAHERGIGVRVLEPREDARHAGATRGRWLVRSSTPSEVSHPGARIFMHSHNM